jgi:hypothetical protein
MPTSRPRSTWSLLARPVLLAGLAGLIVACGGDGDETAGASATSTAAPPVATSTTPPQPQVATSSAPSSDVRVIEVTITNGQVQTAADQVELARGEPARLVVTSDVEDELHVHGGIGFEAELPAGEPTTLDVIFDERGVYYVEIHHSGLQLLQFVVQ